MASRVLKVHPMKRIVKQLSLRQETIRALSVAETKNVAGGVIRTADRAACNYTYAWGCTLGGGCPPPV